MMSVKNAIIMDKTPKMMFVRRSAVIDMAGSWTLVKLRIYRNTL